MSVLGKYNLSSPFYFFEEISKIPRGSGNMVGISNYCKEFAESKGCKVIQDSDMNLLIFKDATPGYEGQDTVIIQGHMDIVCEKVPGSNFDFMNDGLQLMSDGEKIWANGTTLGADNGIAIAMGLALIDAEDIPHGPLEFIFTVDEENGLNGAKSVDLSPLKGRKLINLDSEDDNTVLTSCAGGAIIQSVIPMKRVELSGILCELILEGMKGGHSGVEIHQEHGNSNALMGRVLAMIDSHLDLNIVDAAGGKVPNVITSHTKVELILDVNKLAILKEVVSNVETLLKKEYELAAPSLSISLSTGESTTKSVLDKASKSTFINALMNMPNGVQSMSLSIPGLVETSLNMGVMNLDKDNLVIDFSVRSSKESAKQYILTKVATLTEFMGGSATVMSQYPGWEYRVDSPLRDKVIKVFKEKFNKDPKIGAVHAGLECGLLADKVEGLDCVSMGPNLKDIHSVNERVEIASIEKVWQLVLGILANKE